MGAVCDAFTPRIHAWCKMWRVYWWAPDIPEPRTLYSGLKAISDDSPKTALQGDLHCYETYREMRRSLQQKIKMVKIRAWSDLVESMNQPKKTDPWTRPYMTVMRKLGPRVPPATAKMDSVLLLEVIGTLFPPRKDASFGRTPW